MGPCVFDRHVLIFGETDIFQAAAKSGDLIRERIG